MWAVKFVRLDYKLANVAFRGVTISLDLNSWISFKMFRRKCAKVVFRAQWLVTVGSSWEVVGDSSLVQCKTCFVQIFHMFFFMKQICWSSPKLVPRSRSFLRRGRFGYKITTTPSHSPSQLFANTFCFIAMGAALFLSQTISACQMLFRVGAYLLPFKIRTVSWRIRRWWTKFCGPQSYSQWPSSHLAPLLPTL